MVNLPSERGLQQQPSAQFCWLLCSGAHVTFLDDISRLLIPIEKQKNLSLQQKLVSTKIHVIAGPKLTATILRLWGFLCIRDAGPRGNKITDMQSREKAIRINNMIN